ncbi:hypothetical protein [Intrasporangium sp.]|uniref:hypothetical protein n=1 Tax=Intrasporangium sp. TaxID=1925024 RepID=UPI00293B1A5A|nr:hypothetical protein [Intrasporangium sp.]MDV3222703.1 hypothetical protein [Intrasporangium sp.]
MLPHTKKVAGAAAVGVTAVALGLGFSSVAQADETTPSPTTTNQRDSSWDERVGSHGPGHGARHGGGTHVGLSSLAEKLGVDEAKLQDAMSAVRDDLRGDLDDLRDDVRDGTVDRETIREDMQQKHAAALAEELGIDASEVEAALDEIRADHEAQREQAVAERLDQAVEDGTLTQAEADAVKKAIDEGVIGGGPGRGMGGPMRGGMGGGMGGPMGSAMGA